MADDETLQFLRMAVAGALAAQAAAALNAAKMPLKERAARRALDALLPEGTPGRDELFNAALVQMSVIAGVSLELSGSSGQPN